MGQEIVRQPRKTYTLKAEEIFYYLFFAILLFAKGIGLYDGMKAFTVCLLAAFLCFGVKICLTEHTVGELIKIALLMILGLVVYRSSGDKTAFIYILVIVGMKCVPVRRVFKVGAVVWSFAFVMTTVLALLKQIPDLALVHSKLGLGHIIRWSLGYTHPNVLHISYVILLAFIFYLARWEKKQLLWATVIAYLFNFYIFLYSVSYTGLILTTVYLALNLYFNLRKRLSKAEKWLIQCVFPACTILSVLGPVVVKGRLFDILNKLMNTRWNLSRYFLTEQKISLFGTRITDLPEGGYNIDCSYVYVLMYFGIIVFILTVAAYFLTIRYEVKTDKRKELAIMLAFLFAGMSEPFMANLSFKNLTLLFVGEYFYRSDRMPYKGVWQNLFYKRIRLTPWTEKELTFELPRKRGGWTEVKAIFARKKVSIFLTGFFVFVLAGSCYYYMTEPAQIAYVEVGLSDYWPGETVKPDRSQLPEGFNGLIIGNADGKTEMYALTGNILVLEHFREAVSLGLACGLAAGALYGMGSCIVQKKKNG